MSEERTYETLDFTMIYGDGRSHWVARFYDRGDSQFYVGEGSTPWIAVQWALDERAHRRLGIVRMAYAPNATPTLTPSPRAASDINRTRELVRLPLAESPCTKLKSAAARRARSRKSGAKPASH